MLTSGRTVLSADALHFDIEETPEGKRRITHAVATGDVLLIDGNAMTTCQRVDLNGDLVTGALSLAEIRVKKPGSVDPKLTGFDAFGAGVDQVYMTGLITRGMPVMVVENRRSEPTTSGNRPDAAVAFRRPRSGVRRSADHALSETGPKSLRNRRTFASVACRAVCPAVSAKWEDM